YNPMTGPAALESVERLLEIDAEAVAQRAADDVLARCALPGPVELSVIVASPGLWTHRVTTEVEHRLRPERGSRSIVQMWTGESCEAEDVRREAVAETVRIVWTQLHGAAQTVERALLREGLALALAGGDAEPLEAGEVKATREVLAIIGECQLQSDVFAAAYGDPLAELLGLPTLGLVDRAGCRHAARLAAERVAAEGPASAIRYIGSTTLT
ncbi:MAG: hypothetical protein ABR573_04805, partial [Candidatus Dormibacteria bacterium]